MRLDLDWGVSPAKAEELVARLRRLGIDPALIAEGFTAGGGKGGQKVNKSANCVQLSYPPLALRVRCQRERSLQLNRFLALRELADRIELAVSPGTSRRLQDMERLRRRKSRRKARSRAKRAAADLTLPLILLAALLAAPGSAQGPAPDDDEQSSSVSVEPAEGLEAAPPSAPSRAAPPVEPVEGSQEAPPPSRPRAGSRKGKKKPSAAPGLVYGREMSGKKVSVRPGQVFVVQLAGDPAGGAAWVLSRLDGIALDPVGEVEFHPDRVKPGVPRTGGMFTAGFRAMKAGEALIEMEARRPGERIAPEMLFSLKVSVMKPPKAKGKGKAKPKAEAGPDGEDDGAAGLRPLGDETPAEEPPAEGDGESPP
ncbi:MAG: hypothetical protein A2X36_14805 [Elusimicrobia bacterium GWA2_69_24]|nr:MAG: hypothetical protein A2X36_14805 [Elusimicrobia bacterium GWA2_69_24]HBL19167.1 hypothetical protein [Elusimicrobiota bacterium]